MRVLRNSDISRDKWNEFLNQNPFSSPFQSASFYDFINQVNNFKADVIAIADDSDSLLCLALVVTQQENGLKKFFSKRGIIYGGPLLTDQNSAGLLLEQLNFVFKRKLIYLEIRNNESYESFRSILDDKKWSYIPYQNFKINVNSTERFFSNFNSEKRRQIRKAKKNNTSWSVCDDIEEVKIIYKMMNDLYSTKVKKPLPDLNFFLALYGMFKEENNGVVLVIKKENVVIGGCFCPKDKNTLYDWFRVGLDRDYKHSYPSTFAAYAGMQYASENGLKTYDFMGAGIKGEHYSVRKFKAQFGGELVEHGRFLLITKPIIYSIGKLGLSILQKLK